jgi:bacillithiol biosynthesis cysteine-adding enzyme BshC
MDILWKRSRPYAEFLPRHHPAAGLLAGVGHLRAAGNFAFSLAPDTLPELRRVAPEVLAALEERHRALGSPPEVFASLRLLADGAPAVVTGQQAGLLGGPLFTLLKTLTAIRVARELTARHGRPFVPIFWSETEDHDLDEVNQAWTFAAQGPARFSIPVADEHRGAPVGSLPLGPGVKNFVEDFFAASPATEFTPALLAGLLEDLERSPDWGTWFSRHLDRLFSRHGLVVADSMDPKLAACAQLLWARVLEEPLSLTDICQERGRWLTELGYKPILQKTDNRTPFFLLEAGKRLPVNFERGLFRTPHADHTLIDLLRRLDERPGDFSAAVHLRPHLQDFLLPTAAYIAGPTELAYLLQVLPGYRTLGIPAPTVVLRASLTLVEPAVERTLERFGVDPADLSGGTDGALTALVRREQRFAAPALWESTREAALKPVADLAADLAAEHPDLAQRAEQVRGKVDFLIKELETKSLAELRKKSDTARDQLERARARLFPNGGLQERTLSAYYFLGKYGPGLVDDLLEALPPDTSLHHFGTIVPAGTPTEIRA